ncbi:hypothetical protein K439DRAFT_855589 [Ramaria rubella]|nr:hypothetical protein K439DRAFT_855589 [Ramaria rubella]
MLRLLLRDGTLYYASVCIIHMVNLFLILTAPPDLKPIGGSFAQAFTTLLVCRIVLNLRKQSSQPFHPSTTEYDSSSDPDARPGEFLTSVLAGFATIFMPLQWTTPQPAVNLEARYDLELETTT